MNPPSPARLLRALLLCPFLLLPVNVQAVSVANYTVKVDCDVGQGTFTVETALSASCNQQYAPGGDSDIAILAQADARGTLLDKKVGFRTSTLTGAGGVTGGSYFSSAFIEGNLFTTFLLEAVSPINTPVLSGRMTVAINISGTMFAAEADGGASDGDLQYRIILGNAGPVERSFSVDGNSQFRNIFETEFMTFSWERGRPILIDMTASSLFISSTFGEGGGTGQVFFENSLDWGGILEVLDDNGDPVAGFSAIGQDGTDWSTPAPGISQVPLPGAVWLFASALGLLGWSKRRS